jgi:hypothetical protein
MDCAMFLFTTPADRTSSGGAGLVPAIKAASERTGVDFSYLLGTAFRESGLDPQAAAKTSSARGAFQFIEQTWLSVFKAHGAAEGQGRLAALIETRQGVHFVRDPAAREAILALRDDPRFSALMAGHLTHRNAAHLTQEIGTAPAPGALYAAHVLGAQGAADLQKAVQTQPEERAATLFPQAAKANIGLFYNKAGEPVSVSALYQRLTRPVSVPPTLLAQAGPSEGAKPLYKAGGAPLYGLFRTEGAEPFAGLDGSGQPARASSAASPATSGPVPPPQRTETGKPLSLEAYRK